MNKFGVFLVTLIVVFALIVSVFPIKKQLELDSMRADSIAQQEAAAIELQYNEIKQSKADTIQSLAAVSPNEIAADTVDAQTVDDADVSEQNTDKTVAPKTAQQVGSKPISTKLGDVVASNPKQLAEQKLASKNTLSKANSTTSAVKKAAEPNNKTVTSAAENIDANKNKTADVGKTEVRYKVTVACFADAKREAELRKKFKLKATDPIKVVKHSSNNCWRYMVGNYSNSAAAFTKLTELRKYDKDCQVVQITTKANKETVEIYKKGQK